MWPSGGLRQRRGRKGTTLGGSIFFYVGAEKPDGGVELGKKNRAVPRRKTLEEEQQPHFLREVVGVGVGLGDAGRRGWGSGVWGGVVWGAGLTNAGLEPSRITPNGLGDRQELVLGDAAVLPIGEDLRGHPERPTVRQAAVGKGVEQPSQELGPIVPPSEPLGGFAKAMVGGVGGGGAAGHLCTMPFLHTGWRGENTPP